MLNAYREEADKHGRKVGPDDIGLRRQVLLAPTNAEAEELNVELQETSKRRIEHMFKPMHDRLARQNLGPTEGMKSSGVIDAAAVAQNADADKSAPAPKGPEISDEEYIIGSPRNVADQIIDQCNRIGAGNFMTYHAFTMSESEIAQNYTLWEEVIGMLADADVPAMVA